MRSWTGSARIFSLPRFVEAFVSEQPSALRARIKASGLEHREWSVDGKARLHRYVSQYAVHEDLASVIDVIRCLRSLLGLPVL